MEAITGGNGGTPASAGGVPYIDVFFYVLGRIRVHSSDIRTYFRGRGHSLRSIRRSLQALLRAGYIVRDGRTYPVSESRVAPVPGKGVVVISPIEAGYPGPRPTDAHHGWRACADEEFPAPVA